MQKYIVLLSILFVVTITINAQNDTIYLMKSGVIINQYNVYNQLDSIIFYNPESLPVHNDTMYIMKGSVVINKSLSTDKT
jgi:hypothetical protein